MAVSLEPGDPFEIEYGNNKKRLRVRALDTRQKIACIRLLNEIKAGSPGELLHFYEKLEQTVAMMLEDPNEIESLRLNEKMSSEIIGKVISEAMLSEDDQKKFESLH